MGTAHLEIQAVSKRFDTVQALSAVSASFEKGEIHAVLGENGAGKSTLMGVLGGFVKPDRGSVTLEGKPLALGKPHDARRAGIRIVHQHFMLVPAFSVRENLALAALDTLAGSFDLAEITSASLKLAGDLAWEIPPDATTGDLPVGIQQRIEIVKALSQPGSVLILDEPTAMLSAAEVDDLFRVLRSIKESGNCVILIAHKLSEVLAIADRVTVLRRGEKVAEAARADVGAEQLALWMVGETPPALNPPTKSRGSELLRVEDLVVIGDRGERAVDGLSMTLRAGEILGIGGVDGNGQRELAEAVAGVREPERGRLLFTEANCSVGLIPADRQHDGLALTMSVEDNVLMGRVTEPASIFYSGSAARAAASKIISEYEVKVGKAGDAASNLSGGNQQKVVVGRTLEREPSIVVAVNPTRGLDVKAAAFVRTQLVRAAARGAGVILISSDQDELAELASRTLYINRGALREGDASEMVS